MEPGAHGGKRAEVPRDEERKGESYTERAPDIAVSPPGLSGVKFGPGVRRHNLRVGAEAPKGLERITLWATPEEFLLLTSQGGKLHRTLGRNLPQRGDKISDKYYSGPTDQT